MKEFVTKLVNSKLELMLEEIDGKIDKSSELENDLIELAVRVTKIERIMQYGRDRD